MDQALDCPRCGLINPPDAQRCDCGWDFVTRQQEHSYLEAKHHRVVVAGFSIGFIALFILIRLAFVVLSAARHAP